LESAMENGTTEPEDDDPDEESDTVELLDEVQVAYGVGTTNDIAASQPENPNPEFDTGTGQFTTQTTLREFLKSLSSDQGIQLEGDIPAENGGGTGRNCFSGTTDHYLSVFWWLPINHGNQVQSDSVEFDLGFYTEQCRHNDGSGMNSEDVDDGESGTPNTSVTVDGNPSDDDVGNSLENFDLNFPFDASAATINNVSYGGSSISESPSVTFSNGGQTMEVDYGTTVANITSTNETLSVDLDLSGVSAGAGSYTVGVVIEPDDDSAEDDSDTITLA